MERVFKPKEGPLYLLSITTFIGLLLFIILKLGLSTLFVFSSFWNVLLWIWILIGLLILTKNTRFSKNWCAKFFKASFYYIFIGFSILIGLAFLLFNANSPNTNTTPLSQTTKQDGPILSLTVVEYPKQIDYYCDKSTIKVDAKNTGNESLSYQDIVDGKYQFGICQKSGCYPVNEEFSAKLNNFGTISPNEQKQIVITTPAGGKDKWNVFARSGDDANGEYTYYISFSKIVNSKNKLEISKSNTFSVISNVLTKDSEGTVYAKDCK